MGGLEAMISFKFKVSYKNLIFYKTKNFFSLAKWPSKLSVSSFIRVIIEIYLAFNRLNNQFALSEDIACSALILSRT